MTARSFFVGLLTITSAACIERPEQPEARPILVDRSRTDDALLKSAPNPQHRVGAQFDGIELIGYDVSPEPATRGNRTKVTFYYRATEDISDDWQVFVHMEDQARVLPRFNIDHFPANGGSHTNGWRRGDVIRDEFSFVFPAGASTLEVWTGLFHDEDRLQLVSPGRGASDGANRLRVGTISSQ